MNIEKLHQGRIFKNYKVLCEELGMTFAKSTNSRKSQFKELECHCTYHKEGNKYIIDEVFDKPKEKVENRGRSSIYGNLVQLLITDLLAQKKGHISISKNKLMVAIGMINVNYGECKVLVQKLSIRTGIDEKVIYDFYNTSSNSFKTVVETALNNLMDKRVILFEKIIKVSDKEKYNSRPATIFEKQIIMRVEKEVMEELGYDQISKLRITKDWKEFKNKTKRLIQEQTEIDFYFFAYDIAINEEYIIKERNKLMDLLLEQIKRKESKDELNQLIYTHLLINAQSRHEKSNSQKLSDLRKSNTYVQNFEHLANLLIDNKTKNIKDEVRNITIKAQVDEEMIDSQLDLLFG